MILAGKEYGSGSSRDWAAKGTALLGVKAVIAESYERIHRSNLIGMGVLPLQFPAGETADSLGLDGAETFSVTGVTELNEGRTPRTLRVEAVKADGTRRRVRRASLRIDTPGEADYYRNGGILQYVLRSAGLTAGRTAERRRPPPLARCGAVVVAGRRRRLGCSAWVSRSRLPGGRKAVRPPGVPGWEATASRGCSTTARRTTARTTCCAVTPSCSPGSRPTTSRRRWPALARRTPGPGASWASRSTPRRLEAALRALEAEGARLARTVREVALVEEALHGIRWRSRL